MINKSAIRWAAVAAVIMVLPMGILQASPQSAPGATPVNDIHVLFKLDPRLTRSDQMGDRWISPQTYTGTVGQDTVEVKVAGIDANRRPIRINPEWTSSDPEMVQVSPDRGDAVKVIVKRAGESKLQVSAQGVSKELAVKSQYKSTFIQVQITQLATVKPAGAAAVPDAPNAQEAANFNSEQERLSYALGMNLANALRKQSVEVNEELVLRGFKDAHSGGKTLMTEAQVRAALGEAGKKLKSKQATASKEQFQGLAERNKHEGEAFLEENKNREGVVTLASGLQYKILKAGDGKKPTINDKVVCNYRGTFLDGSEFDSSYKRGKSATLSLTKVIAGWKEALQLMPVGSKWQLFIPPSLAYGARGTSMQPRRAATKQKKGAPKQLIGPHTTLIFEVELVSIENTSGTGSQLAQQDQDSTQGALPSSSKETNQ